MTEYKSPQVSCIFCRKVTSSRGIHYHYLTVHTEEGRNRCRENGINSNKKSAPIKKDYFIKKKKEEEIKYKLSPKICKSCNKPHEYEKRNNKFCSRSCVARNSNLNRDLSIREKQRKTLLETIRLNPIKKKEKTSCIFSYCVICDSVIQDKQVKTCSIECKKQHRMNIGSDAGKLSAAKQVRRSKDEIALYNLCESHFDKVTNNDTSIANGWDADILIHDIKTAILWNGPWHYKEMGFSNHSLKQVQNRDKIKIEEFIKAGWSVLVFEDRYYTPESAFNKILYGSQ